MWPEPRTVANIARTSSSSLPPRPEPRGLAEPKAQLYLVGDEEPAPALRRRPWAWLIKHVFLDDVSVCAKCGGPTRWLEVATKPEDIELLSLAAVAASCQRLGPPHLAQLETSSRNTCAQRTHGPTETGSGRDSLDTLLNSLPAVGVLYGEVE